MEQSWSLRAAANSIFSGGWLKSSKVLNQCLEISLQNKQNKTNHPKKNTTKKQNKKTHPDLMIHSWENTLSSLSDTAKMTGNFFPGKICSLQDAFDKSLFYF